LAQTASEITGWEVTRGPGYFIVGIPTAEVIYH